MKTVIGVIGKGTRNANDPVPQVAWDAAEAVGRLVAERQGIVLTGGLGGVMEAASKGAQQAGGFVVGIIPGADRSEANPYCDVVIPSGIGTIRNHLTVRSSDAVIMIGGGSGTLNEVTICYGQKPLVVLEGSSGWADRLRSALYEGKYVDERRASETHFAQTPEQAVEMAFRLAAQGMAK